MQIQDTITERIVKLTKKNKRLRLVNDKLYEIPLLKDREIQKLKKEKENILYHLNYLEQFYIYSQRQ